MRIGSKLRQGPSRVEDSPARTRRSVRDTIQRQVADGSDRGHAAAAPAADRRERRQTPPASAKAARELGTVVPMLPTIRSGAAIDG
jgi:hypothetical protein